MPLGKTYSVKESAAYLRLSTKTIRRYVKKNILRYKIVKGKHGDEIQIYKKSLDKMHGQIKSLSKGKEDILEVNRLYQEASPEVREVVLKILRSSGQGDKIKKPNNLLISIFRKRKDHYQ